MPCVVVGVYDGTTLLAVTVYKRGAAEVVQRLQALEQQLAEQKAGLAACTQAGAAALPKTPPRSEHVNGSMW